jgi:hypothetical protein
MAEAVPPAIVGETVNLLARGAPDISANGLLRFYLLHVFFLPLVLILFFFVHYYKVVHFGISLPAHEEEVGQDTANKVPADRRVYFLPDVMVDETMFLLAFTTICIILTAFFFQAPLESIANPQSTPLHTVAPWYFYWLQGLLKIADKTIAGVILPGVLLVLLMAIPYLDMNPSRRAKDRRIAIVSGIVAGVVMIIWSWMGTPQYAVQGAPAIEVVQELMPEEGAGHVREMGYEHLLIGAFDTREEHHTGDAEMDNLLHEFAHSITTFDETDQDFNEAYGILTITENQAHLKKIDWEIHWLNADGGPENFARTFFLHEDSMYWEQYGLRDFSYFSLNGEQEE